MCLVLSVIVRRSWHLCVSSLLSACRLACIICAACCVRGGLSTACRGSSMPRSARARLGGSNALWAATCPKVSFYWRSGGHEGVHDGLPSGAGQISLGASPDGRGVTRVRRLGRRQDTPCPRDWFLRPTGACRPARRNLWGIQKELSERPRAAKQRVRKIRLVYCAGAFWESTQC